MKGTPVFEDIHPMVCKAMLYNCKTKNSHKTSYRRKGEIPSQTYKQSFKRNSEFIAVFQLTSSVGTSKMNTTYT